MVENLTFLNTSDSDTDIGFNAQSPLDIQVVVLDRPSAQQVTIALQNMWSQIGVRADFKMIDPREFAWSVFDEWPGGYDYFLVTADSDYPDPANFLSWLIIHSPFENIESLEKRVLATFSMTDNEERLKALGNIEVDMRKSRAILSLFATSKPWVRNQSLVPAKYFHLTGINFQSKTCPSKKSSLNLSFKLSLGFPIAF